MIEYRFSSKDTHFRMQMHLPLIFEKTGYAGSFSLFTELDAGEDRRLTARQNTLKIKKREDAKFPRRNKMLERCR